MYGFVKKLRKYSVLKKKSAVKQRLLPNEASETKVYFRFRASAGKIRVNTCYFGLFSLFLRFQVAADSDRAGNHAEQDAKQYQSSENIPEKSK
jgi:hypothetical protein